MNQLGNTVLKLFLLCPAGRMEKERCQAQNPIKNNRQSVSSLTQTFCNLICLLLATYLLLLYRKECKAIKKAQKAFQASWSSNKATFRWFTCSLSATYGLNFPENAQTLICSQTHIWRCPRAQRFGGGEISLPTPNTIQTVSKSHSNLFLNEYFQYSNCGS